MKKIISVLVSVALVCGVMSPMSVAAAKDKKAPVAKKFSPKQGATITTKKPTLKITFNEKVLKGKNFKKISLKSGKKSIKIKTTVSKKLLKIVPSKKLASDGRYTLTVPAKAIKDKAGNSNKKKIVYPFFLLPEEMYTSFMLDATTFTDNTSMETAAQLENFKKEEGISYEGYSFLDTSLPSTGKFYKMTLSEAGAYHFIYFAMSSLGLGLGMKAEIKDANGNVVEPTGVETENVEALSIQKCKYDLAAGDYYISYASTGETLSEVLVAIDFLSDRAYNYELEMLK